MAIQTNSGERAKLIKISDGSTPATEQTPLYVNGATSKSGSWTSVKNSINRGQTITFGDSITTTSNSNSNSSHGTLIYPANKISVTQGDVISIDVSRHNERVVDTNVTTWTFNISIVYLESAPSDFSSTFDISIKLFFVFTFTYYFSKIYSCNNFFLFK